jgi:lysozyme
MTRLDGIDVSHYQGIVDWEIVRASCARPDHAVAVWKVTQGVKTVDPTAERNRDDTAAAGFRWRLGYHWLSPKTDPIAQARWFLSHFGGISLGEGVIVDAEEPGITADQVLAFCQAVEGTTGRPVAVYTGVHVAGGSIWRDTRIFNGERIRWVAAYVPETRVRKACEPFGFDVWQWSSSGTVPGVTTLCDVNLIEHPIMLDVACQITAPQPPTPTPNEDDMAIATNAETYKGFAPGIVKFVVMSNGSLRHILEPEWHARGSLPGARITNAEITSLGVI